ncbi:MAG TPA: amidohydrolase family protein [Acidimicrobiia bacterium]|nr:amidohydrolase family protein [Acidimicrobiia bacterium]
MTEPPDPGLPIKLGPCSNGEYDPEPLSSLITEVIRRSQEEVDRAAAKLGLTRRRFLKTVSASALVLMMLDEVTAEATSGRAGGRYLIDPEARWDEAMARQALGGDEWVFDLQGHLLEYDLNPATRDRWFWGRQFPQAECTGEDDPRACFTMEHFLEEVFLRSDTTMVAISGLPLQPEGSALPNHLMDETRRVVEALGRHPRVVVNALALPQIAPFNAIAEEMDRSAGEFEVRGWKTFTHFPSGQPWWLDDHDPDLPQVGAGFLEQAARLDRPIVLVHKGLSGGSRYASPIDVGPAAAAHPEVTFIVYHSGFEVDHREGPYREDGQGVDRLITSLTRAGIEPSGNVYAELGTTWWNLMRRPEEAAHVLGKLLRALGEDNIVWGTDSIFYGSPQDQIEAFRAFQISDEFQVTYGYPPLSETVKRKILGENAAKIYGLEPVRSPLTFSPADLAEVRASLPHPHRTYGPQSSSAVAAFRSHHQGWP